MDNQNELLRMISQALQQNQAINNELLKLINTQGTIPPPMLNQINTLLLASTSTLKLIAEHTPTK